MTRVPGVDGTVEIIRDNLGIPHVRAKTVHDAFFGQGFAHAHDRWWQMCFDRRRAEGRLAEWLGPARVRMDAFARRSGLAASARADYDALDADARAMCDAYTAGVNAYLATDPAPPREFELLGVTAEDWRPWDCGSVFKVRHILMGSYDRKLWRAQLIAELGIDAALEIGTADDRTDLLITGGEATWHFDADEFRPGALATAGRADGSNNWAVHGSRTASGLPLVAGDPQRALEAPNVFYQNHIACGDFDAIGFSMAGVPGIFHFGHNATVAWCVTHAMADQQDLYTEVFDNGRYEFRGEWLDADARTETIGVRDGDDVRIDVVVTRHGPVMFGDPNSGSAIAMRWTATDRPDTTLNCLVPMLRAKTVEEMDEAMRGWVDPCNNFVMADRNGTIAYLHRGRVPIRPRANGLTPVPGWTGDHEWQGSIPFEDLPRLRNPDDGVIVTANNRIAGDDYPYYLGVDYAARYRAQRVADRLAELDKATAEDMSAVHGDRLSIPSELFAKAVAEVTDWDGLMEPDSAGAAVYAATREHLAEILSEREPLKSLTAVAFPDDPLPTPVIYRARVAIPRLIEQDLLAPGEWDELIDQALRRALVSLEKAQGPDRTTWTWGAIHTTRTRHPVSSVIPDAARELDPPSVSSGGDGEVPNCTGWESGLGIQHSSTARYVFDLGDWDNSGWVVPLGASGNPRSPHYADQAQTWARVELFPMTYDWDKIPVESSQILSST